MENAIVFVGETGVGKSFLCDKIFEICGSPARFVSEPSLTAVGRGLQQEQISFQGKQFTIVDSQGFFDAGDYSAPESRAKTDGENMCKLIRALELCKDVNCVVFVYDGRFGAAQKLWYDRILDVIGVGYRGQLILMNNKHDAMTEMEQIINEMILQDILGLADGSVQYFPIMMAHKGSSESNKTQVKNSMSRFLSTVSKFAPFNLKDMKIPEICYEREVVEGPFEIELANDKSYNRQNVQGTVPVESENPLMRLCGGKQKKSVHEFHQEEEPVHVPQGEFVVKRVVGIFWRTYKVRFDVTRDLIEEEFVEEKVEKY